MTWYPRWPTVLELSKIWGWLIGLSIPFRSCQIQVPSKTPLFFDLQGVFFRYTTATCRKNRQWWNQPLLQLVWGFLEGEGVDTVDTQPVASNLRSFDAAPERTTRCAQLPPRQTTWRPARRCQGGGGPQPHCWNQPPVVLAENEHAGYVTPNSNAFSSSSQFEYA